MTALEKLITAAANECRVFIRPVGNGKNSRAAVMIRNSDGLDMPVALVSKTSEELVALCDPGALWSPLGSL